MRRRGHSAFVVGLLCVALSPQVFSDTALAEPVPAGPEFRVNSYTLGGQVSGYPWRNAVCSDAEGGFVVVWEQFLGSRIAGRLFGSNGTPRGGELVVSTATDVGNPAVACDADGNFVVAWNEPGAGNDVRIVASRYSSDGARVGSEFQVNTGTIQQGYPAVASDGTGNFVVVWAEDTGVFGRRYASSGTAAGTEFQIAQQGYAPQVAMDADGDFNVAWSGDGDGDRSGVFARRYRSTGAPAGTQFQVNSLTAGVQAYPALTSDADGDFVVAWQSEVGASEYDVFARRFASSGAALGTEFRVNTYTTESQSLPDVAASAGGEFIVTWQGENATGGGSEVFARRYASNGSAIGTEFQVNTQTTNRQNSPSVASDATGNFVVVWQSQSYGASDYDMFARRYREPTPCTADAECDDGSICTSDTCAGGTCRYARANDGQACGAGGNTCLNGRCVPPPPTPVADLDMFAPCRPDPVCAGGMLNCDIHLRNRGPSTALEVTVVLELTGNMQVSGVPHALFIYDRGRRVGTGAEPVIEGQRVTWTARNVPPGGKVATWYNIDVGRGGTRTVSGTSDAVDPNPANNTRQETVELGGTNCPAEFAQLVLDPPGAVCNADEFFHLILFQRPGSAQADLTLTLDPCLDPATLSVLMPEPQCGLTGSTVTCTGLDLDANGRGQVSFAVQPRLDCPRGSTIHSQARITFDDGGELLTNTVSGGILACEVNCSDGVDDDEDGKTDCADENCESQACDDGSACAQTDRCTGGTCRGTTACDACQTCDPATGCAGNMCTPTATPTPTTTRTVTDTPTATPTPSATGSPAPKRPLIFVHGVYGSELSVCKEGETENCSGSVYWPTALNCKLSALRSADSGVPSSPATAELLRCTGNPLKGCSVGLLIPLEYYESFAGFLERELGNDHDVRFFAYDWRMDIEQVANRLESAVNEALVKSGAGRVDLVVHSMGGLVAKQMLTRTNGQGQRYNEQKVRRMIFIGTPHFGAPKATLGPFGALDDFLKFGGWVGLHPRVVGYVAQNMAAAYQLLPSRPLTSAYAVLSVRGDSQFGFSVPARRYRDFLDVMSAYRWQHQACPNCLSTCTIFSEFLNPRMPRWARPHGMWDLWSPADPGLDAYLIYGDGINTVRTVNISANGRDGSVVDLEYGPGDETVPMESASARGIAYFEPVTRRFAFDADHLGLTKDADVQQCVKGLVGDTLDFSGCVAGAGRSRSLSGRAAAAEDVVEVLLTGDTADLALRDEANNTTGRVGEQVLEEISRSQYTDLADAQLVVAPADERLTVMVEGRSGGPLYLRLRVLASNEPISEVHYDFTLGQGSRASLRWDRTAASVSLEIDLDGDGVVDQEVPAVPLPVANAGDDLTTGGGEQVTLDGSRSFSHDGGALTYRWTQIDGPAVALSDPAAAAPSFTAPGVAEDTALAFALEVTSNGVTSRPDEVSILVRDCAAAERCNGIDDNCDGTIDEGNPEGGTACQTGFGAECQSGTLQCNTGELICVPNQSGCTPPACTEDADCADGSFCNGEERCEGGACVPAETRPCAGPCDDCDEERNQCTTLAECSCPEHCNPDVGIPPQLVVEPSAAHDFGLVTVGDTGSFNYTMSNQGGGVLEITATETCPDFSAQPEGVSLAGGEQLALEASFAPQATGNFVCQVMLGSNGGGATIELRGQGVPVCPGDCDHDTRVTIEELVRGVNIALGSMQLDRCARFDTSGNGRVTIDELVKAVNAALNGCEG